MFPELIHIAACWHFAPVYTATCFSRWAAVACLSFICSYTFGLVSSLGYVSGTFRNVSDWVLFHFLGHVPGSRSVGYMVILSLTSQHAFNSG